MEMEWKKMGRITMQPLTWEKRGFTLMEVLVAMTVFTIAFAATLKIQTLSIFENSLNSHITTATFLALDMVETVKNTAYDRITPAIFPPESFGEVDNGNPKYSVFSRIIDIQDMGHCKIIFITVNWHEDQRIRNIALSTLRIP